MSQPSNIMLTSTEIAALWTQYMNDTMSICWSKYALEVIEDQEIKKIYETALSLSEKHISEVRRFFSEEKIPIPYGFTEQDVNKKAPRLFQDNFLINYLLIMTQHGMTGYSVALQVSSRTDVREYLTKCNLETIEFFNEIMQVMLSKGIYTRPPYIHTPPEVAEMAEKDFMTGWFGKHRPLTAIEISNITFNMNKTYVSKAISMAFAQVAREEKIRKFFQRGLKISAKQTGVFTGFMTESNLNSPVSWESSVTNSTTPPFSDKLMMFLIGFLSSAAVGFYGAGQAVCMRRDISAQYLKLTTEQLLFSEDGAQIMLERGWFEKPPMAEDRQALMDGKKE